VGSILWVIYGPIIFYTTEILNVSLVLFFYYLTLCITIISWEKQTPLWWGTAGLVTGLAVLSRTDVLPFAGIVILAILTVRDNRHFNMKKRGLSVLAFFVPLSAMLLAVGIANYRIAGHFTLLPTNSGLNFYIGNNPNYRQTMGIRPDLGWDRLIEIPQTEGIPISQLDPRQSRFFYEKGLHYIIDQPLDWISCLFYKVRNLTNGYELPETFDIYTFRKYSPVLALLVWKIGHFCFPYVILLPLAALGIYFNRKRWKELRWLFAMLACLLIPLILFWNSSRYRIGIVPILCLFASSSICWFIQMIRQKDNKTVAVMGSVLILVAIVFNWPTSHFSKNYNFQAELLGHVGEALIYYDAMNGARLITMAYELDPDNLARRVGFADLLYMQGRYQEAIKQYEEVLTIDPTFFEVHTNLGTILAEIGRYEESYSHLLEAIRLSPTYGLAHTGLGHTLEMTSRFDEAFYHYKEAVRVSPYLYEARMYLGQYLYNNMKFDEALREFRSAVRIGPNKFEPYLNMGHCFLQKGEIDKAIELYKRAKELRPDDTEIEEILRKIYEMNDERAKSG
jgi:tetratricopeptide (TPR) repeat protein